MTAVPPRGSRATRAAIAAVRHRAVRPFTTAVLAAVLLPAASAQAGTVGSYEVESFKPANSSRASVVTDAAAAGGKALELSRPTSASKAVTLSAATDKIVVRVRGVQCSGAPRMAVTVDGIVVGRVDVTSTSYTERTFTTGFAGGGRNVKIAFENGYSTKSCRRKLVADQVRFVAPDVAQPAPAPAPAPSPTPTPTPAPAPSPTPTPTPSPTPTPTPTPSRRPTPTPSPTPTPTPSPTPTPTPSPTPTPTHAHADAEHEQAQVRPAGAEQPDHGQGADHRPEPVVQRQPRTSSSTCPTRP